MTLRLRVLGLEVLVLTLEEPPGPRVAPTLLDNGIGRVSRWWVARGMR